MELESGTLARVGECGEIVRRPQVRIYLRDTRIIDIIAAILIIKEYKKWLKYVAGDQ